MSEHNSIAAELRTVTGKQVKQLRRDGWIPAIIYGQQEPVNVQLERKALRRVLRRAGSSSLIDIDLNGKQWTVLVREIQQHATRGDLMHVDFMEVDMKATLTAEAELVAVGVSPAVEEGMGTVMTPLRSVEIECRPADLVSEIEFDISAIVGPDSTLHVRDLVAPKGVAILSDPDLVIARLELMQEEVEDADEDMDAEYSPDDVEVIGRGDDEEEEL